MELTGHGAPVRQVDEVVKAVRALGKTVLTFGGFGELGYDDEVRVLGRLLARVHNVGASIATRHRLTLDSRSVVLPDLRLLEGVVADRVLGLPRSR